MYKNPKPIPYKYEKKSEHDQACNFLKSIPESWNNEPLITGISLQSLQNNNKPCLNPAFTREWPGTASYLITVKVDDDAED